ncbi:hypothetical protein GCM10010441_08280 [Kitasatospora paracochleata]|uniref:Lipoprotein n=1 Tax=Kitasatospora paracochleata TaxID=58354 RepID=A0ABT1IX56_9ACTN|nr:hypothetical protein [Kitasatospora paracochleata]MCP2309729.1 hypothetical protein [Kitasatospora paracochleata]
MKHPAHPARTAAVLAALALGLLTGCSGGDGDAAPVPVAPSSVALPAPKQPAAPAAALATPAAAGEVRVEAGPFTDRVRLTGLTLSKGSAVGGHLTITSDVSDVLALEVRAAFYDAGGQLVGTGTFRYQEEEASTGEHDGPRAAGEGIDFSAVAEKLTGTPVSAVLSIPVLVNE